jgi:glycosyltransferase involved in cell wall biosynthesis
VARTDAQPVSVCMFSNLFPPVVSGSSTQSASLARELVRRGHRVAVITAHVDRDTPPREQIDGVDVHRLPCLRMPKLPVALNFPWLSYTFTPRNLGRIREILHRFRPDVLHLHNHMFDLALAAIWAKRTFRLPLVLTMHTIVRHAKAFYNLLLAPGDRILLRCLVARHADTLLCPDVNMQAYVRQAFPTSRSVVVPYGINIPGPGDPAVIKRLRAKHNLAGRRVILSLGHVHEVRNRKDLIRALPVVRKAVPEAVVVIVGAEVTDTPRRLARQLGVSDAVIFNGPAPYDEIPSWLALADIEAHLFYQEETAETTSLGIASQEAMAAGKAVISAANADSLGPGRLRHGENVFLVPLHQPEKMGAAIIQLLRDGALRERVGRAAATLIRENFSWDRVRQQTLEAYRQAHQKRT